MPHILIASDRIEAALVCPLNHEKIGTIRRLMVDKISGTVAYPVLKFGGFPGFDNFNLLALCAVFVFLGAVLLGAL
jgi:hypothetical protein